MVKIIPIASGSSGNCMYIDIGGRHLLIDMGVSWRTIKTALASNGVSPDMIDAVFITHTHSDHVKGLAVGRKQLSARFFMSGATKANLCLAEAEELGYYTGREILPGLKASAFPTSHDCIGSAGFVLETEDVKIGYATDLGVMTEDIRELITGADILVIESNHDESMLINGPYPYTLKRRILSDNGHLSNRACAEACEHFISTGTGHIMLAHLSRENNTPELAFSASAPAAQRGGAELRVLPVQSSELYTFEITH